MKAKNILLAGVAVLLTTTVASAQSRRGARNAQPATGFGVVTPFGNIGNPYPNGTGYNNNGYNNQGYNNGNGYNQGYNNTYGYNNQSNNRFNQPTYIQPQPGVTYSQNSFFTPPSTVTYPQNTTVRQGTVQQGTVVYPQGTVMPGNYTVPNTQFNAIMPTAATTSAAPAGEKGLRVTEVKDGGPAEKAGIHAGDVILSVDGKQTRTFEDLRSVLKDTEKKEVNVEFWCTKTNKKETKSVMVKDAKVGVMVVETPANQ